jgi:hypothetical protein
MRPQGKERVDEISYWRIEGIEEDGRSIENHRKKMGRNIVYLQIVGGLE